MVTRNEYFITQTKLRELREQRGKLLAAYDALSQQGTQEQTEAGRLRALYAGLQQITLRIILCIQMLPIWSRCCKRLRAARPRWRRSASGGRVWKKNCSMGGCVQRWSICLGRCWKSGRCNRRARPPLKPTMRRHGG